MGPVVVAGAPGCGGECGGVDCGEFLQSGGASERSAGGGRGGGTGRRRGARGVGGGGRGGDETLWSVHSGEPGGDECSGDDRGGAGVGRGECACAGVCGEVVAASLSDHDHMYMRGGVEAYDLMPIIVSPNVKFMKGANEEGRIKGAIASRGREIVSRTLLLHMSS